MDKEKVLQLALENAIKYGGKADLGAIIGKTKYFDKDFPINEIKKIVEKVNSMNSEEQKKKFVFEEKEKKEEKKELKELPNAKNVVMRLAPFPSGALHIGNAKTYLLNALYAEKYKGKLLLVMDDTIGSEEKQIVAEAYNLIEDAFQWLKVKYKKPVVYKSDRLKIYYSYAEKLIKKNKAYACTCSVEVLRKNREKGAECKCRSLNANEQMKRWKEMFKLKEGKAVLRLKTDMKHPNPAFRDRVLFKICDRKHPRAGEKYRVWPTLEMSWAVDDHLLGITHILRGKDLMIETEMEKYIWDIFGWKHPETIHTGLVRVEGIEGTKISKSKAQKEVKSGKFIGWDDPRTWSIQSLRRRGIKQEAIREFIKLIGLNENDISIPIDVLYSLNRKIVEVSDRHFFVEDPVKITIKNAPELNVKVPLHPDHPKRGVRKFNTKREFYISKKDYELIKKNKGIYRLMHLFNFTKEFVYYSTELDTSLNAKLIHWLPADEKKLVKTEVLMANGEVVSGLSEEHIKKLKKDEVIQFERFSFCKLDKKGKDGFNFWFTHK